MKYDIHCHLTGNKLSTPESTISECKNSNIGVIINGLNCKDNEEVLKIAKAHANAYASIGMHPTEIFDEKFLSQVSEKKDEIVAVGEAGLDYKDGKDAKQADNFKKIITAAQSLNKPLILHSRGAETEMLDLIKGIKVPVILHCFTGKKKLITEALKNSYVYFSVPASVKYSQQFQDLVKEVPVERLFCETDSPYLWKEGTNTPLNVVYSYEAIAKIKGIALNECEKIIENSVKKVFKITEFKNN